MKVFTPRTHGYLDYVTVVAFGSAPSVLGLHGLPGMIAYVLAAVHLALTLITAFPLGAVALVPLRIHGAIELVVSIALVALPWVLSFSTDSVARTFFMGAGIVIFAVWLLTHYGESRGV
jgi:hypothetical protein